MLDALDIPLSLGFDTILLPLTLYEQFFKGSLSQASEKGDLDAITSMLGKGVDIDATDSWGHTELAPLSWTPQKGDNSPEEVSDGQAATIHQRI